MSRAAPWLVLGSGFSPEHVLYCTAECRSWCVHLLGRIGYLYVVAKAFGYVAVDVQV
jgi:hypothetical protein